MICCAQVGVEQNVFSVNRYRTIDSQLDVNYTGIILKVYFAYHTSHVILLLLIKLFILHHTAQH